MSSMRGVIKMHTERTHLVGVAITTQTMQFDVCNYLRTLLLIFD